MKTTKHTPGPWGVSPDVSSHGASLAIVSGDTVIARTPDAGHYGSPDQLRVDQPNARLIAKAPELLTALVDTLDALHNETHGQDDTPWIQSVKDRARAIIAQATGEK